MTAITWGQPMTFNFEAAREQGIIPPKTPTRRNIKNSETNAKITPYDGLWREGSLAGTPGKTGVQSVQFPAGDIAYTKLSDWKN